MNLNWIDFTGGRVGDGRDSLYFVMRLPTVRESDQRPGGAVRFDPGRHFRFCCSLLGWCQRQRQRLDHSHAADGLGPQVLRLRSPSASMAHGIYPTQLQYLLLLSWASSMGWTLISQNKFLNKKGPVAEWSALQTGKRGHSSSIPAPIFFHKDEIKHFFLPASPMININIIKKSKFSKNVKISTFQ